jgi:hypothetical protein
LLLLILRNEEGSEDEKIRDFFDQLSPQIHKIAPTASSSKFLVPAQIRQHSIRYPSQSQKKHTIDTHNKKPTATE